jgi:hypothetical protein
MPIIFQSQIIRADLRSNPNAVYLFGDNEQRRGLGGQAGEMRGEPNAIGIRTKRAPSNVKASFWIEGDLPGQHAPSHFVAMVESDFAPIRPMLARGVVVIIPADGLGTGLARLPELAPVTFQYIRDIVARLRNGRFEVPAR